ncbi:hypothetical protein F383_06397 [Gossypium arboreum]|uniref:Uncharacterized protein n=1 Tax=Gossypium arboreum TaxID=29729 RepID=A0A0B0PTW5_GOSAR|nr:hypothetical protein F383_06397 [Gossypium arboreum]
MDVGEQRTSWGSCLVCRRVWWRGAERGGCGVGNLGIPKLADYFAWNFGSMY